MNKINVIIAAALFSISGMANAFVMDFEDIGGFTNRANFPALGISGTYGGFEWPSENSGSNPWAVVENSDSQFSSVGAYSGEQALWNWSDGVERNIVFDQLYDVQGAYFNVFMANASWGSETVLFNAYDAEDNLIGSSSALALTDNVSNPEWQWLAADFVGVKRLQIIASDVDGYGGGWWTMDDLTLSVSSEPVPEPALIALLGFGLVGFGFLRRK